MNADVSLTGIEIGLAGVMVCTPPIRVKNSNEMANMLAALCWMTLVMAWPQGWVELDTQLTTGCRHALHRPLPALILVPVGIEHY